MIVLTPLTKDNRLSKTFFWGGGKALSTFLSKGVFTSLSPVTQNPPKLSRNIFFGLSPVEAPSFSSAFLKLLNYTLRNAYF